MKISIAKKVRTVTLTILIVLLSKAGMSQTVLFVNLAAFYGQVQPGGTVLLDWSTMMEANNKYFIIQRSSDGATFTDLGEVKTLQNDSTHDFELEYNFVDQSPLPGTSYYRLALVDKLGQTSFTKIVEINNNNLQGIKIYPTMLESNNLFVETAQDIRNARIELFDLSGNRISEMNWQVLNGRQNFNIAAGGRIARGAYVIRITSNGVNVFHQMIIVQSR